MEAINSVINGGATIGSYIAIGLMIYIAITILSGFIYGVKRGFSKSLLRLVTIVAAAVASIVAVTWLSGFIDEFFRGKTLDEIITSVWPAYESEATPEVKDLISGFDAETAERLVMAVVTIGAIPPLFVTVFYILKLLTMIIYGIFAGILGMMSKEKSFFSGLFGGAIGIVQGVLIAAIVLLPTAGFLGVASEMRTELTSDDKPEETVVMVEDIYVNYLDDVIECEPIVFLRQFGGDLIFGQMTNVVVAGEEVDMREEAKAVTEIAIDSLPIFTGELDWAHLTDLQKNAIRSVLADVEGNEYNASIVAGMLRGVAKSIDSGHMDLELEEPFGTFAKQLINIFVYTNADVVTEDLSTLVEIYFILGDSGVIATFGKDSTDGVDVKDLLVKKDENDKTVIDNVITELNENPRTVPIVTSLTQFSLQLMLDAFPVVEALPEDVKIEEVYENVKEGINGMLETVNDPDATPTEKKESVKDTLDTTLKDNNIALDEEIIDSIADHIITEFEGMEELTDQDINNAVLAFYGAYADMIASGEIVIPTE